MGGTPEANPAQAKFFDITALPAANLAAVNTPGFELWLFF
jgi:hypothetical protein